MVLVVVRLANHCLEADRNVGSLDDGHTVRNPGCLCERIEHHHTTDCTLETHEYRAHEVEDQVHNVISYHISVVTNTPQWLAVKSANDAVDVEYDALEVECRDANK